MRRALLTLATLAVTLPLQAQLTPAQRAVHDNQTRADLAIRDLERSWERRSLDGDQTAYAGPTGRDYRFNGRESWRARRGSYRPLQDQGVGGRIRYLVHPDEPGIVRGFIGQRQGRPIRLKPLGATTLDARAGIPLVLTLALAGGGEGLPLLIHAAVALPGAEPSWESMVELEGDAAENYRIEIPALRAGVYEVLVELYYPEEPTRTVSSTRTALTVWQP